MLQFEDIYKQSYDSNDMTVDDIVKDLCSRGTIIAEVYAFFDIMYGLNGTI